MRQSAIAMAMETAAVAALLSLCCPARAQQPPVAEGAAGQTRPAAGGAESFTWPIGSIQEPENPGHHTGSSEAVPELLNEVAKRAPMSVEDFLSLSAKSNPTLDQARSVVRRSEGLARQAGLNPNPTAGYSGDQVRGGAYGGGEQGAFAEQTLVLGGKLGLRRDIYRQQAAADRIGVQEQSYRVRDSVESAFYQALAAQALVIVRQRLLRLTLEAGQTAHQLANVGQADAPDILQAEVESERAGVDFLRAQREFLADFQVLAAAAGAADLPPAPLQGSLDSAPPFDAEKQATAIEEQSPEIRRARQRVAVAQARLKDAQRESFPDLTLRGGEWWSGELTGSSNRAAGPMSFLEAGVKLPLWNRNQGNVEAAKAELEQARQEVLRVQLALRQRTEPLAQRYLAARFESERYRTELLPRARRAYELYLMKYQQMAGSYPQVLLSQRTLFELQIDYIRSLAELWSNAVALQNYGLTDGLQPPAGAPEEPGALNLPNGGGGD